MPARYLDLHVLQDIPPSCLNRGEYNEPKSIIYGNVQRPMLSSQSMRRAQRTVLEDILDEPATRSRMLPPRIARTLRDRGWPDDLATFAAAQIPRSALAKGMSTDSESGGRTDAMIYAPAATLTDDCADLCERHRPALEKALALTERPAPPRKNTKTRKAPASKPLLPVDDVVDLLTARTATINLFGRFLAGLPEAHVAGAVQTAPAWTTHQSDLQPDFFTAVDDWAEPGDPTAAHLDTAYLTAGVFYRYTSVNITELLTNTGNDHNKAFDLLALYIDVFLTTLPQAKKNSTAPFTLPDTVHYAVRERRPISYAPAFHHPVKAERTGGHLAPSRTALSTYAGTLNTLIGTRHLIDSGYATAAEGDLDHLATRHTSFDTLIAAAVEAARQAEPAA
ncbi:type I-E CRISPR-associated protein Cas7/Cse4/CasC [Streptomyces cyaneofuscatus]|uniref:type I-E CRISPR-associated protein Cas7/Cse4/CasC n=1 Tax=Streptomyces cyaneofuscatus TaxID=66883 RepID=UPI00344664DD